MNLMPESLTLIAYLVSGVLFILSLAGLAKQKTARTGNALGIAGMPAIVSQSAAAAKAPLPSSAPRARRERAAAPSGAACRDYRRASRGGPGDQPGGWLGESIMSSISNMRSSSTQ